MGDAAHATVPFFGQGMNCGFEDCTVMWELMQKHGATPEADISVFEKVFAEYQLMRKPNGDAVQDLSLLNYVVMRDKVNDAAFQLQQKIERRINELYPDKYFPMYSMVSFSDIEYHVALSKGKEQDTLMAQFIADNHIDENTSSESIDKAIHASFGENLVLN
jgi:kynurenine 3-monooxygenase